MRAWRLTVLVANTCYRRGLLAEHGLAFWIDVGPRRVLFDTGQTSALEHNARRMGIDLSQTDAVILSHGHYDHTGGCPAVLAATSRPTLYAHPDAYVCKFAQNPDGSWREIGMSADIRNGLREQAECISCVDPTEVGNGLFVTGPIPRVTPFEDTGGTFARDPDGHKTDALTDDQAAYIKTVKGVVVILGCAHAGIVNTLRYIRKLEPDAPFLAVVGGTHLASAGRQRIDRTVNALRELDVQRLYPVHCTGFNVAARLWHELPGRVADAPVGTILTTETLESTAP